MFSRDFVDGVERRTLSTRKRKRRNMKKRKKRDNPGVPPPAPLTTDHFDLTMKRLEDVYLEPIKDDVDSMEKSISKMKLCIEILSVAIASAAIIYVISTVLNWLGIP